MERQVQRPPPGIVLLRKLWGKDFGISAYKASVLIITFIAYALYHMSRKPPSIVKTVLDPEGIMFSTLGEGNNSTAVAGSGTNLQRQGWAPFDGRTGKSRLGEIDVAFLASYAVGIYFAGHLGDRIDLRWLLFMGMMSSGFFVCLFGMGQYWNIHVLPFYLLVQVCAGLSQATGWPSVVAVVGHWFGKEKRGLIMGIWNAHTSIGNILGSLIASAVLKYGWGWSFVVPGLILGFGGLLVWFFLVVEPADVGLPSPYETNAVEVSVAQVAGSGRHLEQMGSSLPAGVDPSLEETETKGLVKVGHEVDSELQQLIDVKQDEVPDLQKNDAAIGFLEAWRIPGVTDFALCLFFSKLVAYTFLYWLPFYIRQTPIAGIIVDEKTAGNLSTLFDVGGVAGGILAGHLSDRWNANAIIAAGFMYVAIPSLFLYRACGSISLILNICLMIVMGILINGPYSLITTAVSADLGTHSSLKGNGRALATVTAIIDGTGSMGAAIGPLLTGYISGQGWGAVFIMLMVAALFSGLLLTKLVTGEVVEKLEHYQRYQDLGQTTQDALTEVLQRVGSKEMEYE